MAQTPRFENTALRTVATGWTASAIYRFSSGAPLSIMSGLDQALDGFSQQRPNQLSATTAAANQGGPCANVAPCVTWMNAAVFKQPALGTLGNMGAYNVLGPDFFQFDIALVRQFRIIEGHQLEICGEAFNVTNSLRLNNPVTLSTPSTFGNVLSAQDPRIMQLEMKYTF